MCVCRRQHNTEVERESSNQPNSYAVPGAGKLGCTRLAEPAAALQHLLLPLYLPVSQRRSAKAREGGCAQGGGRGNRWRLEPEVIGGRAPAAQLTGSMCRSGPDVLSWVQEHDAQPGCALRMIPILLSSIWSCSLSFSFLRPYTDTHHLFLTERGLSTGS